MKTKQTDEKIDQVLLNDSRVQYWKSAKLRANDFCPSSNLKLLKT